MTMSWHTMMEFEPPLVGCVVSNRNHSIKLFKGMHAKAWIGPARKNARTLCHRGWGAFMVAGETRTLPPRMR